MRHVYYFGSTKLLLQLRHQFYLDRDNYLLVYFYHGIIKNLLFAAGSEFFHRDYCGSSARALSWRNSKDLPLRRLQFKGRTFIWADYKQNQLIITHIPHEYIKINHSHISNYLFYPALGICCWVFGRKSLIFLPGYYRFKYQKIFNFFDTRKFYFFWRNTSDSACMFCWLEIHQLQQKRRSKSKSMAHINDHFLAVFSFWTYFGAFLYEKTDISIRWSQFKY